MEAIAARAYQRYLERDGREGSAEGDWLAAEADIAGQLRPRPRRR